MHHAENNKLNTISFIWPADDRK